MSMLSARSADAYAYASSRSIVENYDPRDSWPDWTADDRWTVEEPADPSTEDAAYDLGWRFGRDEPEPFSQFLPAGATEAERKAFFDGLKAGYQAARYAFHKRRYAAGIEVGRRMRASEPDVRPTGLVDTDIYPNGGRS